MTRRAQTTRRGLTRSAGTLIAAALLACGMGEVAAAATKPEAPASARASAHFVLLDNRLNAEPIVLLRLDLGGSSASGTSAAKTGGEIAYLDSTGTRKTRSLADIIALAPSTWILTAAPTSPASPSDNPTVWLDLIDGQRLTGTFVAPPSPPTTPPTTTVAAPDSAAPAPKVAAGDEPVVWQHQRLGVVRVPLDLTSRFVGDAARLPNALRAPLSKVSDTIVLANGDRVEGFIESLGTNIRIAPAAGGGAPGTGGTAAPGPSTLSADQTVLVHLVNEARPLSGAAAWLTDGSILALARAGTDADRGKVTLTTRVLGSASASGGAGSSASLDLTDLRAVVVDAGRIMPLSALPIAAQIGSSDRPAFDPARIDADPQGAGGGAPLGAADILLPGPMVVEWTLPGASGAEGAAMLGGVAQLDESCWAWGNCVVVFSIVPGGAGGSGGGAGDSAGAGREIARGTLNADTPSLNVKADLSATRPGDRLRVRVEAGARGPIQDRVMLRRFIFVSSRPGA